MVDLELNEVNNGIMIIPDLIGRIWKSEEIEFPVKKFREVVRNQNGQIIIESFGIINNMRATIISFNHKDIHKYKRWKVIMKNQLFIQY